MCASDRWKAAERNLTASVYIVWDRDKNVAVPGTFASSADATAHTRLVLHRKRIELQGKYA